MVAYIFDLESNHKEVDCVSVIHSLVLLDIDTENVYSFTRHEVEQGLRMLEGAQTIIGHNVLSYDIKVIEKLYPDIALPGSVYDTLIASRLAYPEFLNDNIPEYLKGKHSLEAWGYRLGEHKGTYGAQENAWDKWTPEMQAYCEQDVLVTFKLYKKLVAEDIPELALNIEHKFQWLINKQTAHGILLDYDALRNNVAILEPAIEELLQKLAVIFPSKIVKETFIPKRNNKTLGYVEDVPFIKEHEVPFNPKSDDHVRERLLELGWKPTSFTAGGKDKDPDKKKPKVSEKDIQGFNHPSVQVLLAYKKFTNALTKLYTGETSWLNTVASDGRVHGRIFPFGAKTRRVSHSKPNVSQLVKNDYFDGTCLEGKIAPRDIVIPSPGFILVGADASGIEARCLGHYTYPYDNGELAHELVHGDIHTKNLNSINAILSANGGGAITRDKAKVVLYATMYGAQDPRIGASLGYPKHGGLIRKALYDAMPALEKFKTDVEDEARNFGGITLIDGGFVPIGQKDVRNALNYKLQGCAAITMKQAYICLYSKLLNKQRVWGEDYAIIMYNHDEFQAEVRPELAEEFGQTAVGAIKEAGEILRFNISLDGEYKIGKCWADTH